MIKKNAVAGEEPVRFPVINGDVIRVGFGTAVR